MVRVTCGAECCLTLLKKGNKAFYCHEGLGHMFVGMLNVPEQQPGNVPFDLLHTFG